METEKATMELKTIRKTVQINAPKEKVWDVLVEEKYNRLWYAEFSEGSKAETDWKVGSKAIFTDKSGNGIITNVVENKPGEALSLEYAGEVTDGREIYDSAVAMSVKGGRENYRLTQTNNGTTLEIIVDMTAEYYDMMLEAWDRALLKLKEVAEQIS